MYSQRYIVHIKERQESFLVEHRTPKVNELFILGSGKFSICRDITFNTAALNHCLTYSYMDDLEITWKFNSKINTPIKVWVVLLKLPKNIPIKPDYIL